MTTLIVIICLTIVSIAWALIVSEIIDRNRKRRP